MLISGLNKGLGQVSLSNQMKVFAADPLKICFLHEDAPAQQAFPALNFELLMTVLYSAKSNVAEHRTMFGRCTHHSLRSNIAGTNHEQTHLILSYLINKLI